MQIEVLSVTTNTVPTAKGSYQVAEVAYKDEGGKVTGKKIMSFANKDVFTTISKAKTGDVFSVTSEKDDKGYWQWKTISTGMAQSSTSAKPGTATPRSTYETPEERKQRQDYIIRQSSLSSAIAALKTEKSVPSVDDVLKVAEQFVQFVYNKQPESGFEDMDDDIPL